MDVSVPVFIARCPMEQVTLPGCCWARPRIAYELFLSGIKGSVLATSAQGPSSRSTFRLQVDFLDGQGPRLFGVEIASAKEALKQNGVKRIDSVALQFLSLPSPNRHRRLYEQLPKDRQWHRQEFQDVMAVADHFNIAVMEACDWYLGEAPLFMLPGQNRLSVLLEKVSMSYLRDLGLTQDEITLLLPHFIQQGGLARYSTEFGKELVLIAHSVLFDPRTKRRYSMQRDAVGAYWLKVLDSLSEMKDIDVDHTLIGGYYIYPLFKSSLKSALDRLTFFQRVNIASRLTKEVKQWRENGWMHSKIDLDSVYLDHSETPFLTELFHLTKLEPKSSGTAHAPDLLALGKLFETLFSRDLGGHRAADVKKIIAGLTVAHPQWTEDQVLEAIFSLVKPAW